jgi:hypothetical protein
MELKSISEINRENLRHEFKIIIIFLYKLLIFFLLILSFLPKNKLYNLF